MKQKVLDTLDRLHIPYEYENHPAAYTMEEIEALHLTRPNESIAKNLFLRDGSGKRHFLVLVAGDKLVDLKTLRQTIGSSRLIGGTAHETFEVNQRFCLSHGNLKR